jgi:two-component system KDP operon response regulator KdpE
MPTPRILIVDDEPHVRQFLRLSLQAESFSVLEAATAEEALTFVHTADPALMILDLGLPDIDGQQVIRDVRLKSTLPILVLSGRSEDSEKIAALDHGADDYINKPFAVKDLVFRVRAALEQQSLRRTRPNASGIATGDLHIFLDRRAVTRGAKPVTLDEEEYALLRLLALHGGRVLTSGRLERALWGKETDEQRLILQQRISALRHKIEIEPAFPRYIVTEPAVGYRLEMLPAISA